MNKTTSSLLLSSALLATTAVAGVPLNGLQGEGGIAFNPVAFLAGTYADGTDDVHNHDYYDLHAAWFATESLTLVAAYVDTGSKSGSRLGVGDGFVLSAQYQF
jgi:hypothetical protein